MRFLLLTVFPPPNKSCFKLTPSISHLSVYFPLGTLASSNDAFKTVTIQRWLLHTFYAWGNEGSQMGIEGFKVTNLPGTVTPPFVSQTGPQNSSSQSSLFLYTTHTSIYLTCFPTPFTFVTHFQSKFYLLSQGGGKCPHSSVVCVCLFSDRVLYSQAGLQFSTALRVT